MTKQKTQGSGRQTGYVRQNFSVITDARTATSEEHSTRVRRYTITMAFRTACFIGMIFAPGAWRWVLFGCAVFLPYIAVLFANQAHQRGLTNRVETPAPEGSKQLTTGQDDTEVISGQTDADVDSRSQREARTDVGTP
jgi:hypothetical protein